MSGLLVYRDIIRECDRLLAEVERVARRHPETTVPLADVRLRVIAARESAVDLFVGCLAETQALFVGLEAARLVGAA